jgi:hypothetical protein
MILWKPKTKRLGRETHLISMNLDFNLLLDRKMLKKLVWDKLLQRGYVKRNENTKACYHQIYQSSQFILVSFSLDHIIFFWVLVWLTHS